MSSVFVPVSYSNLIVNGNQGASPNTNPLNYVPHEELATKPPAESWGDNAQATRVLRCRWQDRMNLAWQLLGGPCYLGAVQCKIQRVVQHGRHSCFQPAPIPLQPAIGLHRGQYGVGGQPDKGWVAG